MGIPAPDAMVLIAFSGCILFVHFPTDVLAGIVMGTLIAWSVENIATKGGIQNRTVNVREEPCHGLAGPGDTDGRHENDRMKKHWWCFCVGTRSGIF